MNGSIHVWDWQTRKSAAVCTVINADVKEAHPSIQALAFSRNGKLLASGGFDRVISIWDPSTGQRLHRLEGHQGIIKGLAFSPDDRTLASCGDDGTVRLWDVAAGKSKKILQGHVGPVSSVAFSPDGRTLASASGEVKLWQTATGGDLATFTGPGVISSIAWEPHGNFLAGGGHVDGPHGVIEFWSARAEAK
jgi:WD40 repeat protein